jgi:hypothetical protein
MLGVAMNAEIDFSASCGTGGSGRKFLAECRHVGWTILSVIHVGTDKDVHPTYMMLENM